MPEYEAGRELDALIHTRVMGLPAPVLKWGFFGRDWWDASMGVDDELCKTGQTQDLCYQGLYGNWAVVPEYSTDIAAAWEIVEKLDEKGAWLDELANKWESSWRCIITRRTPGSIRYYQDWGAETASLAICRAALQMVEHSENGDQSVIKTPNHPSERAKLS